MKPFNIKNKNGIIFFYYGLPFHCAVSCLQISHCFSFSIRLVSLSAFVFDINNWFEHVSFRVAHAISEFGGRDGNRERERKSHRERERVRDRKGERRREKRREDSKRGD